MNKRSFCYKNKRILVTGACGSIGKQLIRMLLNDKYDVSEVVGIDNNESELFFIEQQFLNESKVNFFLADIRDRDKLCRKMKGIDIVFHAAAFKHVALCERSPFEAVQTNIIGVQNVIYAACENNIEKVVFTSSDKAVNPTNVMGTSKLMGERLMTAANSNYQKNSPIFTSTRFGNVLGSSGSVIPIFHKQIAAGGPVTLTHKDMTRFIMSIEQAVTLVLDSMILARGGGVFITKMPVIRIKDLAEVMVEELTPFYHNTTKSIEIIEVGTKPGEKLYEELMSSEETRRALELEKYFVVLPAFRGMYKQIDYNYDNIISKTVENPYNSSNESAMTKPDLRDFLLEAKLLDPEIIAGDHPAKRYWPGEIK